MYKVLKRFCDLKDKNHVYDPNIKGCDTYPREGLEPTAERIAELSGKNNKLGCKLIEKVEEKKGKKTAEK